jgi:hypothetical protein
MAPFADWNVVQSSREVFDKMNSKMILVTGTDGINILALIETDNENSKPYRLVKSAGEILIPSNGSARERCKPHAPHFGFG